MLALCNILQHYD